MTGGEALRGFLSCEPDSRLIPPAPVALSESTQFLDGTGVEVC